MVKKVYEGDLIDVMGKNAYYSLGSLTSRVVKTAVEDIINNHVIKNGTVKIRTIYEAVEKAIKKIGEYEIMESFSNDVFTFASDFFDKFASDYEDEE